MKNILILDDDVEICELLKDYLASEYFHVRTFNHPDQVLKEPLDGVYDLCIIDIMLPKMSGFDVLKNIRSRSNIPVIMLTARGEEFDRILGLELGADDYIPKPFSPRELTARMKAVFRRTEQNAPTSGKLETLEIENIRMLFGSRQVFLDEKEILLTAVEFKLLEVLMRGPGKILRRQELAQQALNRVLSDDDRSLDVHMSNLRKKIRGKPGQAERIQTIRSIGFVFTIASEKGK